MLKLIAVGGLVLISLLSYFALDDILSAQSLRAWLIRSWSHPLVTFLVLWVIYDLVGLIIGVPLGGMVLLMQM